MSSNSKTRWFVMLAALAALLVTLPESAEAQRRRPVVRGPAVRSVLVVRPYVYPRFNYGWYQWGYPYPYPVPPYGYRYGGPYEFNASLRIQVTPNQAEVFVDGYRAGTVNDFDGVFQRLRLRPGGHEITIFLEGYETVREAIYLEVGADEKLQFAMNRLGPGERSELPAPPAASDRDEDGAMGRPGQPARGPAPADDVERRPAQSPTRFGTLSLRVQPADAEIFVDGERWATPGGDDRISIQLAEGRHRIEVRKQGMASYSEDILIRRGATFTLNVSLK